MQYSENVFVMDHPLIKHKLTYLRDKNTGSKEFRQLVSEIATLECYEATRDLPLMDTHIETPVGPATTQIIAGRKLAFVPILRAGLGMVDGVLTLVPAAKVGHIGLYRDPETLAPVEYYSKLPLDIEERDVILLDPMLLYKCILVYPKLHLCSNNSSYHFYLLDLILLLNVLVL